MPREPPGVGSALALHLATSVSGSDRLRFCSKLASSLARTFSLSALALIAREKGQGSCVPRPPL